MSEERLMSGMSPSEAWDVRRGVWAAESISSGIVVGECSLHSRAVLMRLMREHYPELGTITDAIAAHYAAYDEEE